MNISIPQRTRIYQNHTLDSERWLHIDRRDDDIIVATPYKCGTTWTQAIVLHLIFQDFKPRTINDHSFWVDTTMLPIEDLCARLDAQAHRRVLKSHLPLDGFAYRKQDRILVVGRDPRDVFMSLWNHYSKYTDIAYARHNNPDTCIGDPLPRCPDDIRDFWASWINHGWFDWESEGYPMWSNIHHVQTWWELRDAENILLLHYNDMLADLPGKIAEIAENIGIDCSPEMRDAIAEKTSFATMKKDADIVAADPSGRWRGGSKTFINKGTNGRWKSVLTADDLAMYERTASRELSPDCRAWLEAA